MKDNIGMCALCKEENVELRESHIIPKLAYKRIKAFQNSRFRNFYDINSIYQDGEKKPLLCSNCELFFSKYETHFANNYLDKFLEGNRKLPKLYDKIDIYIFSVAWRILYDDLFILNSFDGEYARKVFEEFEKKLLCYLEELRIGNSPTSPQCIKNYIFTIRDLGFINEVAEFLEPSLFGYSFHSGDQSKYIVFSHYAGIIIATVYRPANVIILGRKLSEYILDRYTSQTVKKLLNEEIIYQVNKMIEQQPINEKVLEAGLREKIKNRYKLDKRMNRGK
ncbi:MAG: hypothetical protein NC238_04190 [Dehalobacter sp.]|nr:hypothetical protein [Dehalobacter sp.]